MFSGIGVLNSLFLGNFPTSIPFSQLYVRSIILNFYLKDLINVKISLTFLPQNGGLSALPYLCMYLMSFPVSYIADLLVNSRRLSLTNIRRISTLIGLGGPSVMFVALAFVGCDSTLAILALCAALALSAGKFAGHPQNSQDMSPNYAGTELYKINFIHIHL